MDLMILVYVLLIIAFAKALGEAVSRVNQPPIVGELLAGIILGPFVLGKVFSGLHGMWGSGDSGTFIRQLADLGILFLMLYVGLEFSPGLIKASSWLGTGIAVVGIAVPASLGVLVGIAFGLKGLTLAFMAVAMAVTALPVTIRILKDMGVVGTRTSGIIVSAALVTDIALLMVLGVILGAAEGSATWSTAIYLAIGFIFFFVFAMLVGRLIVPYIYRLLKWMRTGEAAFAVAVGIAIAFAIVAEWVGLPGVIGAFIAGLLLRETGKGLKVWARVEDILSGLTLGFLAPIFFVLIGFSVDFNMVAKHLPLFAAILSVAIIGKVAGSYVVARSGGLSSNESMAIGSMMMGKGAMELVFAQLALETGLFRGKEYLFSLLILMAFVSTILAPILFRVYFNRAVIAGEVPLQPRVKGKMDADLDTSQYA
jgi:Kef-type K+ transport system membrane component KefB